MENTVYGILLENAEMESRVLDKYMGVGITNENAKDFIADKTSVVINAIKRLYETIMNIINNLTDKVLNFAATRGANRAQKIWKDLNYSPIKIKGVKFNNIEKLISGKFSIKFGQIEDDEIPKDDRELIEKELYKIAYAKLTGQESSEDVNKSNFVSLVKDSYMKKEQEYTLSREEFTTMKNFVAGSENSKSSAASLIIALRAMKQDIQNQYKSIIENVKKDFKGEMKDADDEGKKAAKDVKNNRCAFYNIKFQVYSLILAAVSDIVKQYVKASIVVGKKLAKNNKKELDSSSNKGETKSTDNKSAESKSATLESVMEELDIMQLESIIF